MSSLAVKYRPQEFSDCVGQNLTIEILKSVLASGNIPPVIGLFGPSGCGKTTIARIIANKINDNKGRPIELDAASNNSIEDVRAIIDSAKQRSFESTYKIFIIDECHALSRSALEALLKLFEQPSPYTKFIMCTTNPEKLTQTLMSRMQAYYLTKVNEEDIIRRLRFILGCEAEEMLGEEHLNYNGDIPDYDLEDRSLSYIAKLANGGVRQSIAYLEKVLAKTTSPSYEDVITILGSAHYDTLSKATLSILENNARGAVMEIESAYQRGTDINQFVLEWIKFLVEVCKLKLFDKDFSITTLPETEMIAQLINLDTPILPLLNNLTEFYEGLKYVNEPRPLLESKVILWSMKGTDI